MMSAMVRIETTCSTNFDRQVAYFHRQSYCDCAMVIRVVSYCCSQKKSVLFLAV